VSFATLDRAQRLADSAAPRDGSEVLPIRRTRGDVDYDALVGAVLRDRARYLDGLSSLRFLVRDRDKWNAEYDYSLDEIRVQPKFSLKDSVDKVRTLLHEAGHRGHDRIDRAAFAKFIDQGLASRDNFLATANQVHLDDLEQTGEVIGGDAREVFAESYARYCLGIAQPDELNEFWEEWLR
jgi:hypothetical protein